VSTKRVLIIEDEELQRLALHDGLELRNFSVASAATAAAARRLIAKENEAFDVVVIDMHLRKEGERPGKEVTGLDTNEVTGAHIGIEIKRKWPHWSPEFLISSAYTPAEYYRLALDLGVAAYLPKALHDVRSVMRHVRALALRRGLSVERPSALDEIRRIAETSRGHAEAVRRFCSQILCRELAASLGMPFVVLLTDRSGTYGVGNRFNLPDGVFRAYATVQALTHGKAAIAEPFTFRPGDLRALDPAVETDILARLENAAFIPLAAADEFRLSLGLLPEVTQADSIAEAAATAGVLLAYFRPAVLRHLLTLTAMVTELHAKRLAVLRATSQFSLYVGQEQLATLAAAQDAGELLEAGRYCEKLELLAADLRDAGEELGELGRPKPEAQDSQAGLVVSMREIVEEAWHALASSLEQNTGLLSIEGGCLVQGRRDNLQLAAARVLQWLVQRMIESPPDSEPAIFVRCSETPEGPEVSFEDRSRRLSDQLREFLFVPFSQASSRPPAKKELRGPGVHLSLYMAKMLVELGTGGVLEDQSAEVEGGRGHRLVMRFPPVKSYAAA
jgi:DNA-binding NarL/FixJ family response regulator